MVVEGVDYSIILLDRRPKRVAAFASVCPRVVRSVTELDATFSVATRESVWISFSSDLTAALVKRAGPSALRLGSGLFIHTIDIRTIPVLTSLFRRIAFSVDGGFLPAEELAEVLQADDRANLVIGGFANHTTGTLTLWRGHLESLTVPFSSFQKAGDGTLPDFSAFSVIDGGQTVKLGSYEAAVDAILYEHDVGYRREIAKRRLEQDRTFGAALRRLRKQRGLRREDFAPEIAAKTVARIEQGKVTRVHASTLNALAKHLGVSPPEITSY